MKRTLRALMAAGALTLATFGARANDAWPNKPIHIVVPFTAGGVVDSIARIVADKLGSKYDVAMVVENKPGAGGSAGTAFVAKAAPDGYTLLCVSPGHVVTPSLIRNVAWDPVRDFRGIEGFGVIPNVIVVPAASPVKTLPEFIAAAKKSPGQLTYGTAGIGTSNHLSGELLSQSAGLKLSHIPYKGQPDALNDLLAGRLDMMPLTAALAAPHLKSGQLRALAVTTSNRSAALPAVPTAAEAGNLPGYEVGTWFGFVAPAKTPDAIVRKLSGDIADILAQPDVKAKFETLGMELAPQSPPQFDAFVKAEQAKWTKVIQQAGVVAQ